MKNINFTLLLLILTTIAHGQATSPGTSKKSVTIEDISTMKYEAVRINNAQPIVTQDLFRSVYVTSQGENINGPSLIRVPDWIAPGHRADPSAQYYLYFAHHDGPYIRMAWAAHIEGPWHLYDIGSSVTMGNRGVIDYGGKNIQLDNGIVIENNHLASPDVHIDHENQRIIMYFHSGSSTFINGEELKKQRTYVSYSPYGLEFYDNIQPVMLGNTYYRVFSYGGELYALTNDGTPYRAPDPSNPWTAPAGFDYASTLWQRHPDNPFQNDINDEGYSKAELRVRHTAVRLVDDVLHIFYTRRGELIERVQWSSMDLKDRDWEAWDSSYPPAEILRPAPGWEGGELPAIPSETSSAPEDVNQLRDPFVFEDADGSLYLIYTGRGEDALGLAALYYYEAPPKNTAEITDLQSAVISGSNDDEPWISESGGSGSPEGEGVDKLIDNDPLTKYTVRATESHINIAPGYYSTLEGYAITYADDHPERDPKIFELRGLIDSTDEWVNLHADVNHPVRVKRFEKKYYAIGDAPECSEYRLVIRDTNGDSLGMMQLAELQLYGQFGTKVPVVDTTVIDTTIIDTTIVDTTTTDTTSTGAPLTAPPEIYPLTVYPNPTNGIFALQNQGSKALECRLYTLNGQLVSRQLVMPYATSQVYITKLPQGMYMLVVSGEKTLLRQKIIKQ